jgi:hypothetical protein
MRFCTNCGGEIADDAPYYYTKCRACYRGAKQQETANLAAEVARQRELAAKYRSIAIERRLKLEALEAGGGGVSALTPDRITELLMLVHPDKHRNSPESNSVPRRLLEVRARQRNAR